MAGSLAYGNDVATSTSGTTQTVSITTTAGQGVFVLVFWSSSGGTTASFSDPTNGAYAVINSPVFDGGGPDASQLFYLKSSVGGTVTGTCALSASVGFRSVAYWTVSGQDTAVAVQASARQVQANAATTANTVTAGSQTPTSQPNTVFGVSVDNNGAGAVSAGTGYTGIGTLANRDATFGSTSRAEFKNYASTSATAATFTIGASGNRMTTWGAVITDASGGGSAVPIAQASEADSAQTLPAIVSRGIGQAAESDAAQPVTLRVLAGQVSEADTAQGLTVGLRRGLGQASEADQAQAVATSGVVPLGQASQTDAAQAFVARLLRSIGQPPEADAAQGLTLPGITGIGPAADLAVAQSLQALLRRLVGQAAEADSAAALTGGQAALGLAAESDFALTLTPVLSSGAPVLGGTSSARPNTQTSTRRPSLSAGRTANLFKGRS